MGFITKPIELAQQQRQTMLEAEAADIRTEATISGLQHQQQQIQEQAARQEELYTRQAEAAIGRGTAAYGASGVSLQEGSALNVLQSQRQIAEEDVAYLRETAAAQVAQLEEQIGFAREGGEIQQQSFELQQRAITFQAITTGFTELAKFGFNIASGGMGSISSGGTSIWG